MKILLLLLCLAASTFAADRPNIIFIVGEDLGPELGCYGDALAVTPNIDRLASQGARFTRAFTHAPVCAPSRSGLLTGQFPTTIGTHHMRSRLVKPPVTFTRLLRDAGYFVAWPGKTDFNFEEPADFADTRQGWLKKPAPTQPFFAYVNFTQSHESQVRNDADKFADNTRRLTPAQRHDPAKMVLPPYYPDTPEARADLARYYDLATSVDHDVGDVLKWIDDNGIAGNTVVIFFGDHGRGLPRSKRWCYDSGLRVPLIVRWPGHIEPGAVRGDLVCFLDLSATCVALGGGKVPADFRGRVFLGPDVQPEPPFVFGARDYMDETFDRIRSVRGPRFHYLRNYHPELPYAQPIDYMEKGPAMQAWRRAFAAGELTGPQKLFFAKTKPKEELYDTELDPWEIRNLADDPQHAERLAGMRAALDRWVAATRDMAETLSAEQMVEQGIIRPRDEKYIERREKRSGLAPAP